MFDYSAQKIATGYTIPITLGQLTGAPTVHIEHLGNQNKTWLAAQIAEATGTAKGGGKIGTKRKSAAELERAMLDDIAEQRRILAAHAIRELEAKHVDGTPATKADIPAWVESIPDDIVERLFKIATNPDLFRRTEDPAAIAGK